VNEFKKSKKLKFVNPRKIRIINSFIIYNKGLNIRKINTRVASISLEYKFGVEYDARGKNGLPVGWSAYRDEVVHPLPEAVRVQDKG